MSASHTEPVEKDFDSHSALLRLHAARDIPQFWSALQVLLSEAAPHDALIVYLNFLDFAQSWRAASILTTPNARRPIDWFEGRRRVDMTPQFVLSQAPGLRIYRLSDVVPDQGELRRTAFFRNYLAPGGWQYLACQLYWRGSNVCSQIALRRTREQGDFRPEEIARLEELHPHIQLVVDRLLEFEEERARRRWLEDFNDRLPLALLSLTWELEPVFANKEALEQCAAWSFGTAVAHRYGTGSAFHTPASIVDACSKLKADWLAGSSRPRRSQSPPLTLKIAHPHERGLIATVTLQAQSRSVSANPGFVVHLEDEGNAHSIEDLPAHRELLSRLTPAERDLARYVRLGWSNREIARKLGKSVKTVKGQLTSVYRKLEVAGRSRLLARMR